ncbi:MAG: amidohydrolase family protein [Acetobacteraceae bacterium]
MSRPALLAVTEALDLRPGFMVDLGLDEVPVVDAHHHLWDLEGPVAYPWLQRTPRIRFRYGDYGRICRSYPPAAYRADAAAHRIVATVHMEAECDPGDPVAETCWLSHVMAREGFPMAAVAQVRLDREDVAEVLAAQASYGFVRGVRHKPAAAGNAAEARRGAARSMDDPRWRAGYALLARHGFAFDLQTPWWHLDAALELARDFPRTTIVLNHAGLPMDRSREGLTAWRRAMERFSAAPNVRVKISGLGTPHASWPVRENARIARDVVAIFGVDRCMLGSNFPVDSLCARLDLILTTFKAALRDLPSNERARVMAGTAEEVYRLQLAADAPAMAAS